MSVEIGEAQTVTGSQFDFGMEAGARRSTAAIDPAGASAAWPAFGVYLYCGDAYEILPQIGGRFERPLTACVTDPPYEFKTSGGGQLRKSRAYVDRIEDAGIADGFDDSILSPSYFNAVAAFCHDNQCPELWLALRRRYRRAVFCAWLKTNPMPVCNGNYVPQLEPYIHAWNAGAKPVGTVKDLLRVWQGPVGKSEFDHPTVKPLDLMRKIIRNVGLPLIVDPFCGSGTTGVAAVIEGRRFVGIEKNPAFFEIAAGRIKSAIETKQFQVKAAAGELAPTSKGDSIEAAWIEKGRVG